MDESFSDFLRPPTNMSLNLVLGFPTGEGMSFTQTFVSPQSSKIYQIVVRFHRFWFPMFSVSPKSYQIGSCATARTLSQELPVKIYTNGRWIDASNQVLPAVSTFCANLLKCFKQRHVTRHVVAWWSHYGWTADSILGYWYINIMFELNINDMKRAL